MKLNINVRSMLIHGDDEVAVYRHYESLVADLKKTYELVDLTGTASYSPRQSLFSETLAYQMRVTSEADLKLFLEYLGHGHLMIGYYHKALTPTQSKQFDSKKVQLVQFKLSKVIWQFLENLTPDNPKLWSLYDAVVKEGPREMVMGMVLRQLAYLNLAKFKTLEDVFFGWQKDKLQSQANKFDGLLLKKITNQALTLDVAVKTGMLNIETALTRLLISINES